MAINAFAPNFILEQTQQQESNKSRQLQNDASTPKPLFASTAPAALSLPVSGGAIRPISENFNVNSVTGTCTLSIPIDLSSSRSGPLAKPSINLSYDSGAGNGVFGYGWHVSLDVVERKTSKGIPKYEDDDVFLLSGEDLVPKLTTEGNKVGDIAESQQGNFVTRKFWRRNESTFDRIERWTSTADPTDVHWRKITPDNVTHIFGASAESRIMDPFDESRIYSWLLCGSWDSVGNAMIYHYKTENSEEVSLGSSHEGNRSATTRSANRYLKSIKYGNTVPNRSEQWLPMDPLSLPDETWMFSVILDYGEHEWGLEETKTWKCRQDPFSVYKGGFEVRTYRTCQKILMFHHIKAPGEAVKAAYVVKSMSFEYLESNSSTFLKSVVQSGHIQNNDLSYSTKSLPPFTFDYTAAASIGLVKSESVVLPGAPIRTDEVLQWIDLDGEGIPGLLSQQGGKWSWRQNLGPSLSGIPQFNSPVNLEVQSSSPGTDQFVDIDGSGLPSIVYSHSYGIHGYHSRRDTASWGEYQPFSSWPIMSEIRKGNLKYLDLTGDGLVDMLLAGENSFSWAKSLGKEGYDNAASTFVGGPEGAAQSLIFTDAIQSIFLSDMSGDGMTDLVLIKNGQVAYWPNLGYGKFGSKISMDNAPWFESEDLFSPARLKLIDIDGNGLTDILYFSPGRDVLIFRNCAGNAWGTSESVSIFSPIVSTSTVDVVDLFGTGTACLVWTSVLPDQTSQLKFVDLVGGSKPNLLQRYDNGMGLEVQISYAASTKFFLDDERAGTPWATRLPFPVQCLEKTASFDKFSGARLSRRYRYHHGFFDAIDREFRGFGLVEEWDTEDFELHESLSSNANSNSMIVAPTLTKTWFHTGVYFTQEALLVSYTSEYALPPVLKEGAIMPVSISGEEQREAYRALAGRQMRQEVYAQDTTPNATVPVQITEASYILSLLQTRISNNRQAVFSISPRESVVLHHEQAVVDPRIQHTVILETDTFGNILKSVEIAYGRNASAIDEVIANVQKDTKIIYNEFSFTSLVESDISYRLPLKYESQSFEVLASSISKAGRVFDFSEVDKIRLLRVASFDTTLDHLVGFRREIEYTVTKFRGRDLNMLQPGQIDEMALPGESLKLVMSEKQAKSYPDAQLKTMELDFHKLTAMVDFRSDGSYWCSSGTQFYSPSFSSSDTSKELQAARSNFFVPRVFVDAFGNQTLVEYDEYNLLQVKTTDAMENITTVINDYRVLQPYLLSDINGNQFSDVVDELGVTVGSAVIGKSSDSEPLNSLNGFQINPSQHEVDDFFAHPSLGLAGSLLGNASSRSIYDLSRSPPAFCFIQREADLSTQNANALQVVFSYIDGSGKPIQEKRLHQTPTDSNKSTLWLTSGWTVLNNKGLPARKYEPFFDSDHIFNPQMKGVCTTTFYDPLGRVLGTLIPNGLFTKTVYGAWEKTMYDVGDLVLQDPRMDPIIGPYFQSLPESQGFTAWHKRTSGDAAKKSEIYAETPKITYLDALGTSFYTKTTDKTGKTRTSQLLLDVQGRTLGVIDTLGRRIAAYVYNMIGQRIHTGSIDTGAAWQLYDGAGVEVCKWNSRGVRVRNVHDKLRRVIETHVRENSDDEYLTAKFTFGEMRDRPEKTNSRGKIYQIYDQAGCLTTEKFDVRGNPVETSRVFAKTYNVAIDWKTSSNVAMESESYTSEANFDALGRMTARSTPDGSHAVLVYSQSGKLTGVSTTLHSSTDSIPVIKRVEYNARGQETSIEYGNSTTTSREYDSETFQVTRIKTVAASTLQDTNYEYDCIGKIIKLTDSAQSTIFFQNQATNPEMSYTYDFLERLTEATGREHLGRLDNATTKLSTFSAQDSNAVTSYTETYSYDLADNFLQVSHASTDTSSSWTKTYEYAVPSFLEPTKFGNKLSSIIQGNVSSEYSYDGNIGVQGCPTKMPGFTMLEWDYLDQLKAVSRQKTDSTNVPEISWYVYDYSGARVRKVTEASRPATDSPSILKETFYLNSVDVFHKYTSGQISKSCSTLKISALDRQIVQFESLTTGTTPSTTLTTRYQVASHLPSIAVELDDKGNVLTYEEYSPFGSTTYFMTTTELKVPKRYRFSGKELDRESGLSYFGRRYLATDVGRWISADPIGLKGGTNLFCYVDNDPINQFDAIGLCGTADSPRPDKPKSSAKAATDYMKDPVILNKKVGDRQAMAVAVDWWKTTIGISLGILAYKARGSMFMAMGGKLIQQTSQGQSLNIGRQIALDPTRSFLGRIADVIRSGDASPLGKFWRPLFKEAGIADSSFKSTISRTVTRGLVEGPLLVVGAADAKYTFDALTTHEKPGTDMSEGSQEGRSGGARLKFPIESNDFNSKDEELPRGGTAMEKPQDQLDLLSGHGSRIPTSQYGEVFQKFSSWQKQGWKD